jgi:hypothetical protein
MSARSLYLSLAANGLSIELIERPDDPAQHPLGYGLLVRDRSRRSHAECDRLRNLIRANKNALVVMLLNDDVPSLAAIKSEAEVVEETVADVDPGG